MDCELNNDIILILNLLIMKIVLCLCKRKCLSLGIQTEVFTSKGIIYSQIIQNKIYVHVRERVWKKVGEREC